MECSVEIRLGEKKPAMVGFDSLISMQPQLCVDGEALTKKMWNFCWRRRRAGISKRQVGRGKS